MKSPRLASIRFIAALLLAGCASDGGVTGTGISAIVAGHVTLASGGSAAGVEVSADGVAGATDDAGNFELTGDLSGRTELRFSAPGRPDESRTLQVSIPAGATTVLEEVTLDFASPGRPARLSVARHGSVVGRIQSVSCISNTGVAIELGNGSVFSFQLSEEVIIHDGDGVLLDCTDLRRDDRIEATGVQLASGTSIAYSIDLTERPAEPLEQFTVEFGGSVNDLHCEEQRARVIVLTDADPFLANVRGTLDTQLFCVDGDGPRPCECEDIVERDIVQVRGTASVEEPGAVVAESVYIFPGPTIVDAAVVVRGTKCNAGKIETEAFFETTSQLVIARFDETTSFSCEGTPCACRNLRPGDVVRLVGSPIVARGRPFVDALAIERQR